jgi:hypothetical protein
MVMYLASEVGIEMSIEVFVQSVTGQCVTSYVQLSEVGRRSDCLRRASGLQLCPLHA